jgi:hypothetical protein
MIACGDSAVQAPFEVPIVPLSPNAALIQTVSGDDQEGTVGEPLPSPLVVEVVDSLGIPIEGVPVVWTARGDSTGVTTFSDGEGRSAIALVLGPRAGVQHIDVRIGGVEEAAATDASATASQEASGRTTVLKARARPAKPHRILTSHSSLDLVVGESVAVTATVVDRFGNVIPDAVIEWRSDNPAVASVQIATGASTAPIRVAQ